MGLRRASLVHLGACVAAVSLIAASGVEAQTTQPRSRMIAPEMFAPPAVDPSALERIDPRPPLSTIAPALPPPPKPPSPLLRRPVATAAGVLEADGRIITIAHVEPTAAEAMCERPDGNGAWPCGRAARTAFRGLLRSRAVTCDLPEGEVPPEVTTACRVGRVDIGGWLVGNGWARALGETYAGLDAEARDTGRGMHGAGPGELPAASGLDFVPDAPSPAGTDTLGPEAISILPDESEEADIEAERGDQPPAAPADGLLPAPVSPPPRPVLR